MQRYDCDTEQCIVDETRHLRARMLQVKTPFNLFILDHNFRPRNARKSIKGSKDSDSCLVSNENFSEALWPSGWALGWVAGAKMTKNCLWRHCQKNCNPQP